MIYQIIILTKSFFTTKKNQSNILKSQNINYVYMKTCIYVFFISFNHFSLMKLIHGFLPSLSYNMSFPHPEYLFHLIHMILRFKKIYFYFRTFLFKYVYWCMVVIIFRKFPKFKFFCWSQEYLTLKQLLYIVLARVLQPQGVAKDLEKLHHQFQIS